MQKKDTFFYVLTIFPGAFLSFQVQPIISKFILPWVGGTAAVRTIMHALFSGLSLWGIFICAVDSCYE